MWIIQYKFWIKVNCIKKFSDCIAFCYRFGHSCLAFIFWEHIMTAPWGLCQFLSVCVTVCELCSFLLCPAEVEIVDKVGVLIGPVSCVCSRRRLSLRTHLEVWSRICSAPLFNDRKSFRPLQTPRACKALSCCPVLKMWKVDIFTPGPLTHKIIPLLQ